MTNHERKCERAVLLAIELNLDQILDGSIYEKTMVKAFLPVALRRLPTQKNGVGNVP
jgi:hypothetical protein